MTCRWKWWTVRIFGGLAQFKTLRTLLYFWVMFWLCVWSTGSARGQIDSRAPFFHGSRILISGSLDNQRINLIFDTGASQSLVFGPTANRLGILDASGSGTEGNSILQRTRACDLLMLGQQVRLRLPVLDYQSEEGLDGVFSWNNLAAGLFMIDGYERTISFPKEVPVPQSWKRWELHEEKSQLFLLLTQNEMPFGKMFVDTGAICGLRVRPELLETWQRTHPQAGQTLSTFRYALGETILEKVIWADEFELGDLRFYDVAVSQLSEDELQRGGKDYQAMIGINALRNLRLIVDRKEKCVLTQSIPSAGSHNRMGAVFLASKIQPNSLVASVLAGTPAHQAGIRNEDKLISIDGLSELTEVSANRSFHQPAGTQIRLVVERDGEKLTYSVTLKELLR